MYKLLAIALIFCFCSSSQARDLGGGDVTIFLKATDKIDIDVLKQMNHTDSVYKVEHFLSLFSLW